MAAVPGARVLGPMTHANGKEMGTDGFLPFMPSKKVNPINAVTDPSPANRIRSHQHTRSPKTSSLATPRPCWTGSAIYEREDGGGGREGERHMRRGPGV